MERPPRTGFRIPGINHAFIGPTPEQTRDANLKALDATFSFLDGATGNRQRV
jgi:hypothetical protein